MTVRLPVVWVDRRNKALLWLWMVSVPCAPAWGAGRMARHISDIPGMPVGMTDVGPERWRHPGTGEIYLLLRMEITRKKYRALMRGQRPMSE